MKTQRTIGSKRNSKVATAVASDDVEKEGIFADLPIGCRLHFLDSGSFTLWTVAEKWAYEQVDPPRDKRRVRPKAKPEDYYELDEFFAYVDEYAEFIKKHKQAIDYYANVDAIGFPDITWRNQRYMEDEHGLDPVPVVHYKTEVERIAAYIKRGRHKLLALGGLVGSTAQDACRQWLDRAFDVICDQPSRLPLIRTHGFGVASYPLLFRYPWWSVDSTAWTMIGANGGVIVPYRRDDKWIFATRDKKLFPEVIKFSNKAKEVNIAGRHFKTLTKGEKAIVLAWLEEIGIPLGRNAPGGEITTYGVTNRHCERKAANLLYFERLRKSIPKYPWPFPGPKKGSLGIKV